MVGRLVLYASLVLALGVVVVGACTGPAAQSSPTQAPPLASTPRPFTPAPSAIPTTTTATPPASASASAPASPGSMPAAACPRVSGGVGAAQAQLIAVRIAHQPGFDRLVFEFGPSTAPGSPGIPPYVIEAAGSLSGASGQPVAISGNALFGVRFQNASTRTPTGTASYPGSTDIKPLTPLIKQVKLVEDFERVLTWGAGLDHLACPKVLELAGPFRVVLDFPTPP